MKSKKFSTSKVLIGLASSVIVVGTLIKINSDKLKINTFDRSTPLHAEIDNNSTEDIMTNKNISSNEDIVKITVAGDVLYHLDQLQSAYDKDTASYDFNDNFKYIKSYIEDSDFSLATCETTFAGAEYEYSGFPLFNTPNSALDSLKNTGFDMLSLASNHILDVTSPGFFNTIDAVKETSLDILGIRDDANIDNYTIKDVNGIKIGFTSYCFETDNLYGQRTLNSIPIPNSIVNLINTFGHSTLDYDLSLMSKTVDNMKADGAEFIIFVMHWGDEYSTEYSASQKQIAEALNSYGVDVIFGSHPHVVQPIEKIKNPDTSKETLVFYSLGNFLSNQRLETMGNSLSANGALAQLEIKKDSNGVVKLKDFNYIPTWVYKYNDSNNVPQYNILPIEDTLNSPEKSNLPQSVINELHEAYESTTSIMGDLE